jgi:short-subunit dehydrogenase
MRKSVAIVMGASQGIGRATAIRLAYLVSKEARWLTGASVRMDGSEIKGT